MLIFDNEAYAATVQSNLRGVSGSAALATLHPDDEPTRDHFVRSCCVVLDVQDAKLLPTETLDKFCRESTEDDVEKCREVVVNGLQEAHRRKEPLNRFCGNVYDWFQDEYGDLCPKQCFKKQCEATCAWIKKRKVIDDRKAVLEGDMGASKEEYNEIQDLKASIVDMRDALIRQNRTQKKYRMQIGHARKYLKEAEETHTEAKKALEKSSGKAEELKKEADALKKNITDLEEVLFKKKHEASMAELELKQMDGEAADAKQDVQEQMELLKELEGKIASTKKELKGLEKVLGEEKEKIKEQVKKIESKGKDVEAQAKKVKAEEKKLAEIQNNETGKAGGPVEVMQEKLVQDLMKKLGDVKAAKRKLEKTKKKMQFHEKNAEQQIAKVKDTIEKGLESKKDMEEEISGKNATFEEAEGKAKEQKKVTDDLNEKVARLKKSISDEQGTLKKVTITLKFADDDDEEKKATEEAAAENLNEKQTDLDDLTNALGKITDAIEKDAMALEDTKEVKDKKRKKFKQKFRKIVKKGKKLKKDEKALYKITPEIVDQHDLHKSDFVDLLQVWMPLP